MYQSSSLSSSFNATNARQVHTYPRNKGCHTPPKSNPYAGTAILSLLFLGFFLFPVLGLTESVISETPFNQSTYNSSTAFDVTGYDLNVTLNTGTEPGRAQSILNESVLITGSAGGLIFPASASLAANPGSISYWYKIENETTFDYLFCFTDNSLKAYHQGDTDDDSLDVFVEGAWSANIAYLRVPGKWYHFVLTWTASNFSLYIDSTKNLTVTKAISLNPASHWLIGNADGPCQSMTLAARGYYDELHFFNVSLSLSEVHDIFVQEQAGYGYPYDWMPPPALVTGNLTIHAYNVSASEKNTFSSGENIFFQGDYFWSNNTRIPDGNCSFSIQNSTVEHPASDPGFTLCSSGCDYDVYSETFPVESADETLDAIHFHACDPSSSTAGMTVNLSCSLGSDFFVLNSTEIPLCSSGNPVFVLDTVACLGALSIDINITTTALFNARHNISGLALDRQYPFKKDVFGTSVFFNSTSERYYSIRAHEYYFPGTFEAQANCSHATPAFNANATFNFTILGNPPLISLFSINNSLHNISWGQNLSFTDSNVSFYFSVTDIDLTFVSFELSNSSAQVVLINNSGPFIPIIPQSHFKDFTANPFEVVIIACDASGSCSNSSTSLVITDQVLPICTGFNDIEQHNGSTASLSANCYDEALFSLNITCDDGYVFGAMPIIDTTYAYADTHEFLSPSTCSWIVCDGHTSRDIRGKFTYYKYPKQVKFKINGHAHTFSSDDPPSRIDVIQDKDRIRTRFDFGKNSGPIKRFYYESPDGIFIDSDLYAGWIISPSDLTWFDAELKGSDPFVEVRKLNSSTYQIDIFSELDIIEFESIGALNCYNSTFNVTINNNVVEEFRTAVCPTDTNAHSILFSVLIIVALVLFYFGSKHPGFGIMGSLLLFPLSWPLFGCSILLGGIVAALGLFSIIYFALKSF